LPEKAYLHSDQLCIERNVSLLAVVCTESRDCVAIGADDAEIEDEELEGVAAESTEQEFSFTEFVLR